MTPMKVTNEAIEYYMYLIVIKLAVLIGLFAIKTTYKIHSSYKRNLKKKYKAKDVEAPKPAARNNN